MQIFSKVISRVFQMKAMFNEWRDSFNFSRENLGFLFQVGAIDVR